MLFEIVAGDRSISLKGSKRQIEARVEIGLQSFGLDPFETLAVIVVVIDD